MSVFEKIQFILIDTRRKTACDLRREQVLTAKNIEALRAAKQQIETILSTIR